MLACLTGLAANAHAGSMTTCLPVIVSVVATVDVTATIMDFGRVTTGEERKTWAYINLSASKGATVTRIELDGGLWPVNGGIRRMATLNPGEFVPYELYKDENYSTLWNSNTAYSASDMVLTSGGSSQQITVYGKFVAAADAIPGDYADTVTITVTY